MTDYRSINKEPKEVKRNGERKNGIMKICAAFTDMLERASEISHNRAKQKTANFTNWLNGTVDGVTDMVFAEENYMAYDRQEKEMKELKELKEKKKED